MSRSIDERVVSMQFDNKKFKAGVQDTMKLLEQFDKQLKFEDSAKSFEELSKAANRVDLSGLTDSAKKVEVQFSALEIAAITVIANIVTAAQNAGTQLIKSLSIDQVTAGFDKYAQKTASVQTIMNATGKSVEEVTAQLAKLQWFSDETSYSFTDMVSNVGKFTSNSIDLSVAVSAMEGIATAAAHAGAGTQEASRAMYNFSQAMAKGYVQLIDWKSIENANMATTRFKQTIIDTAVELGTLNKVGEKYQTIQKQNEVSASNFNEALSEGWLTNDVLLKALAQYSAYADAVYEVADGYDTAAEAMEHVSEEGMKLGAEAFKAAQQAKTFQEAIDATKDAVSSGWMETFEIIFGNFNESVKLWTEFTNALWDIFASGAEVRNDILRQGLMSGWNQFIREGITDTENLKSALIGVARDTGIAIDEIIETAGSFEDSLHDGWLTADIFTKAVNDMADEFKNLSNEELAAKGYTKDTAETIGMLKGALDEGTLSAEDLTESLAKMSGRENILQGIRNGYENLLEILEPVRAAFEQLFPRTTAETVYELTERFKNFTAQLRLSEEASYSLYVIVKAILTPFRLLWQGVKLGAQLVGVLALGLWKLTDAFLALLAGGGPLPGLFKEIFGEERYNRIIAAMAKITQNLGNAFSLVAQKATSAWNALKESQRVQGFIKTLGDILGYLGEGILDAIVWGFEALATMDFSGFVNWVIGGFQKIIELLTGMKSPLEVFNSLADSILGFKLNLDDLPGPLEMVSRGLDGLKSFVYGVANAIAEFTSRLSAAKVLVFAFGTTLVLVGMSILNLFDNVAKMVGAATGVTNAVKNLLNTMTSRLKVSRYTDIAILIGTITVSLMLLSRVPFADLGKGLVILAGGLTVILGVILLYEKLTKDIDKISTTFLRLAVLVGTIGASISLMASAISMLAGAGDIIQISAVFVEMIVFLTLVTLYMTELAKHMEDFAKGSTAMVEFSLALIAMSVALKMLAKVDLRGSVSTFVVLGGVVAAYGLLMKKLTLLPGESNGKLRLTSFAIGLVSLAGALWLLSKFNTETLIVGLGKFALVFVAYKALMMAVSAATKNAGEGKLSILGISVSIILMAQAVKMMGSIRMGAIGKALLVLAELSLFFLALAGINAIGKFMRYDDVGTMLLKTSAAMIALSLAVAILGSLDIKSAAIGVVAVGILMLAFAQMIKMMDGAKKAELAAATISVAIGLLVAAVALLSLMDPADLIAPTIALVALMLSLGQVFKSIGGINWKSGLTAMGDIILVVGSMLLLLSQLSRMTPEAALARAGALSLLMITLAGTVKIIAKMGNSGIKNDWTGVFNSLLTVVTMSLIAMAALSMMPNVENIIEKALGLSIVLAALAGVTAILSKIKMDKVPTEVLSVLGVLSGIILLLGVFAGFLGSLDNAVIFSGIAMLGALEVLLLGMTGLAFVIGEVAVTLGKIPGADQAISTGLKALTKIFLYVAAAIAIIVAAVVAVGAILEAVLDEKQKAALLNGINYLGDILYAVGESIGKLIGGWSAGLFSGMPEIGQFLADFAINVKPFLDTMSGTNGSLVLRTFETIVKSVATLAGADFQNAITKLLGGSTTSFTDIGDDLYDFGKAFKKFADVISDIPEDTLSRTINLCDSLVAIANALPATGGALQAFTGSQNMETFGDQLAEFGNGFRRFYNALTRDGDIDYSVVESCTNAGLALSGLVNSLPNFQGASAMIFGDQSLSDFGEQLVDFGHGFRRFYQALTRDGDIDYSAVESCTNAGLGLAKLTQSLPNATGWWQAAFGSKDVGEFGDQLTKFGSGFRGFYNQIADLNIDPKLVSKTTNAGKALASLAGNIPTTGGFLGMIFGGEHDFGQFGKDIEDFGAGMASFYNSVSTVNDAGDISSAVEAMMETITNVSSSVIGATANTSSLSMVGDGLYSFSQGLNAFYNAVATFEGASISPLDELHSKGESFVHALIKGIEEADEDIRSAGKSVAAELLGGFNDGVSAQNLHTAIAQFRDNVQTSMENLFHVEGGYSSLFLTIGSVCVESFIKGFEDALVEGAGMDAAINFVDQFLFYFEQELGFDGTNVRTFEEAAYWCVQGFANGLQNNAQIAVIAVQALANSILGAFLRFFKIASPSRLMRDEVGRYIVQGVAEGIDADMSAEEAAAQKAQNIMSAFQEAIDEFDLDLTTLDLQAQLAEALGTPMKDSEIADQKMQLQAQKVILAEAQWKAVAEAAGENSEEAQKAYNSYLQAQITLAQTAQQTIEASGKTAKTQSEAFNAYADWMADEEKLLAMGFSADEIQKAAMKASGFTGEWDTPSETNVQKMVDSYLEEAKASAGVLTDGVEIILDESLETALSDSLRSAGGGAGGAAMDVGSGLADGIMDAFGDSQFDMKEVFEETIGDAVMSAGESLVNSDIVQNALSFLPEGLRNSAMGGIETFVDSVNSKIDRLYDVGKKGVDAIFGGSNEAAGESGGTFWNFFNFGKKTEDDVAAGVEANLDTVTQAAQASADQFPKAYENATPAAVEKAKGMVDAIDNVTGETFTRKMRTNASNAVEGFLRGLGSEAQLAKVKEAAAKLGNTASSATKSSLQERSPSRLFYKFGDWAVQGLANGMEENTKTAVDAAEYLCSCIAEAADDAMTDTSYKPVITPVVNSKKAKKDLNTLYFDALGNLVPFGFGTGGLKGTSITVDDATFAEASKAADKLYEKWVDSGFTADRWKDSDVLGSQFQSQLLNDLYKASKDATGQTAEERDKKASTINNYTFNQTNTSPVALSPAEIYRDTKNLFAASTATPTAAIKTNQMTETPTR